MVETPKRCFVISPIGKVGSPERKHADMTLNAIIRPALAASQTTFEVTRGDESSEIGMITDHIITEILESDLVIADFSFLNPNVFYQLGIVHAVEKPVIHIALAIRQYLLIILAIAPLCSTQPNGSRTSRHKNRSRTRR